MISAAEARTDEIPRVPFLDRFGLFENPFLVTPSAKYTFLTASTAEALEHGRHLITGRMGLGAVTGEVGTGKTTLLGVLAQEASADGHAVAVLDSVPGGARQSENKVLGAIAADLGLKNLGTRSVEKARTAIRTLAREQYDAGRTTVVFLDESHRLKAETLHTLKSLLAMAAEDAHFIQIVLFGQLPEMVAVLQLDRAFHSRLALHTRLNPMTRNDVKAMIEHRLGIAGRAKSFFQMSAIEQLYVASKGVPRDICTLAGAACMIADDQGSDTITGATVKAAAVKLLHEAPPRSDADGE